MDRFKDINEAMEGPNRGKSVDLVSELMPGASYMIDGNGPFVMGSHPIGDNFTFRDAESGEALELLTSELEGLINDGKVITHVKKDDEHQSTVPDYPHLDRFTRNTFAEPTRTIWDRVGIEQQFSMGDLLDLDNMVHHNHLQEMPMSTDSQYEKLLRSKHWSLLKRYLTAIVPTIELPEVLA